MKIWSQASGSAPQVGLRGLGTVPDRQTTELIQSEGGSFKAITHYKLYAHGSEYVAKHCKLEVQENGMRSQARGLKRKYSS
jgi:hypothetical protein